MKTQILNDEKLTTAGIFFGRFQDAEPLKYAPGKRCLFQVRIKRSDYFVKLYPKKFLRRNRGNEIHRAGQKFWRLSRSGILNFRVPQPVFWDAETRTLWQKKLDGVPAVEFLKRGKDEKIAFRIGQAIAQIAGLKIVPPRRFDRTEQMKDSREFAAQTIEKFTPLKREIENLLFALNAFHRSQMPENLVPAHGDMHIDQWLFDGENPGLLDFEDFSLAEIERDPAFFAVQIETEYGAQVCAATIEKAMLAGFESAGKSFDKNVFEIYKAHKWLSKTAKVSKEIEARAMLEKAFECLRGK